jgi:hypothetical protein
MDGVEIHLNRQVGYLILELRHTSRAQNLVAFLCEHTDIVRSLFAANRQIKD